MIRYKILITVACIVSSHLSISQTNLFTLGDNGDFESVNSEKDMLNKKLGGPDGIYERITLERSTEQSYSGSYSLKFTSKELISEDDNHRFIGKRIGSYGFNNYKADRRYIFRAKLYVPLGAISSNTVIKGHFLADPPLALGTYNYCITPASNTFRTDSENPPWNQWTEISGTFLGLGPQFESLIFLAIDLDNTGFGVFYIDKIEVFELAPIKAMVSKVRNNITIDASGGVLGADFHYLWNDGYVGNQRKDLPPGDYVVTISQPDMVSYVCADAIQLTVNVSIANATPLCEFVLPLHQDGEIKLDKFSGLYVFQRNQNCSVDIPFGCIQGQTDAPQLKNVVSASATTFSDSWKYDYLSSPPTGNALDKGEVGKWRPQATYAYNKGNVLVDKNYNSGTFQLSHFNWQYPEVTRKSGWMKVNEVTKYTPNGEAVEEKNSLDILSTAKFGYSGALPYLIAQNASYNSVLFEGFENLYSSTFEDGVPLGGNTQVSTTSHSGGKSLLLGSQFTSHVFTLTKQLQDKGLLVRAWVNGTDALSNLKLKLSTQSAVKDFSLVARSGVWSLVEARIDPGSFGIAIDGTFTVSLVKQGGGNLWIDDVRMQPADAEVSCYVYDVKTLRVLTVFDDQHFGLFYQYNAEGKLVRKQIETARGIKTVQETQYNIPEKNKADFIGE